VILSKGITTLEETKEAIRALKTAGSPAVALLHCVSSYPAQFEQMNLRTILDIPKRFNVIPGLSDHSLGIAAAVAAVSLGACIIEKHFTLSRKDGGPDAAFSLTKDELKELVLTIRNVEKSLGAVNYTVGKKENENRVFKRSIYVIKDIKKGDKFTPENIRIIRPGYGMHPRNFKKILGKRSLWDVARGARFRKEFVNL
jgi:pseudaminic acid synthase